MPRQAGRGVADRGPMAPDGEAGEKEGFVADEGVAQSPEPPPEAGPYRTRGACSRRTDALVLVVAAPVPILVTRI